MIWLKVEFRYEMSYTDSHVEGFVEPQAVVMLREEWIMRALPTDRLIH